MKTNETEYIYREKKRMTPDKLRSYPGCEHHTDEEAEEIINSLEKFAQILFDTYQDHCRLGLIDEDGNMKEGWEDHPEIQKRRGILTGRSIPQENKNDSSKRTNKRKKKSRSVEKVVPKTREKCNSIVFNSIILRSCK